MCLGSLSNAPLKNENAQDLERDHDRHVFLSKGEARFAPLNFFGQAAVDCDLA
jgi:hypothetical protein